MQTNPNAVSSNGDDTLRLEFVPRSQLPRFLVRTQTVWVVYAPTDARARHWFADTSDIELDIETLDSGQVEVIDQIGPEYEPGDVRYWPNDRIPPDLDADRKGFADRK